MSNLFIDVQYRGDWWGEDPMYETAYDNVGDLYRGLTGQDKMRPWQESMGRCTGKVYVDGPDGDAKQVGWVFEARNPEPVNRGDEQPTGLRIAWVTVHDAEPTVTKTYHYTEF